MWQQDRTLEVINTSLNGVKILKPRRFEDDRGYFSETWNHRSLVNLGINIDFVQDNQSYSRQKGTVRGLHFQFPPHAQDKLVRVVIGRIWDVAVDIRKDSETYGKWTGCELSAENGFQLLVPKGFLHGFSTLEDHTEVVYKCSHYYSFEAEGSIRFDDPEIGIDWMIDVSDALLSAKDVVAPLMKDFDSPFRTGDE